MSIFFGRFMQNRDNILKKTALILLTIALLFTGACGSNREAVYDPGNLLSAKQQERITDFNQVLLNDLDIDFFLVISDTSIPEIDRGAAELFKKHKVGQSSSKKQGVLLLVDPLQQQVRLEVSYTLEPIFPDSFVGYIQRRQMLPFFNTGKIGQGVEATIELLVTRAMSADHGNDFDPLTEIGSQFLSGGGGADIGYGKSDTLPRSAADKNQVPAQPSPQAALDAYILVLANHNKRPDLELYSPKTRIFFSNWVVTDAQCDNVSRKLQGQTPERIFIENNLAVIRFPVEKRTLTPYFLIRGDKGWMFDFATMNRVTRFNHKNQWHFTSKDHPYAFGFADLRFGKNGFPFN